MKHRDCRFKRFGANKHQYRSFPVSGEEIENFENKFGILLPLTYKIFLIEIGYGAGPFYGIFSLRETMQELEDLLIDIKDLEIRPTNLFPFGEEDIQNLNEKIARGDKSNAALTPTLEAPFPSNGCIPICHQGCTYWTYLVVTGELRGSVWDVANFEGDEGFWLPGRFASKLNSHFKIEEKYFNLSFEDWIENWIETEDRALTTIFSKLFRSLKI